MLWIYGVISNHIPPGHTHCPTQSHAHTSFNTFVPAKHTNRVADLQEQLFSLFFLDSSIIALNRFLGRRSEDDRLHESFPEMAKIISKNTHERKRFLFFYSVLLHCQFSDRPFIAACFVVCSSVQHLHICSFCKSAKPSKNLGMLAAINRSTTCGHGFGWANRCGLLRRDRISHPKPISFIFQEILYEMCFWCSSSP